MNTIFAEFISPKVSKLHYSDPTIKYISFPNLPNDVTLTENILSKFKAISCGEFIEINEEESFQMKIISVLLDNKELFCKLNDLYSNNINETNINESLTNLAILTKISQSFDFFNNTQVIDFISSHFYSIDKEKLQKLPRPIIYSIISNKNLKLESEDSLIDFIDELFRNVNENDKFDLVSFYEEVEFPHLSQSKLDSFSASLNPSIMTHRLWAKLRHCLHINKNDNSKSQQRYTLTKSGDKQIKFDGNESHALCGIIDFLTKESGGNVSDNGTVKVTSLGSCSVSHAEKNVVDLHNSNNYFQSINTSNTWLKYDFIGRKLNPTGYSIRTRHDYDGWHPRTWVIEGSNTDTENNWTVLDTRENITKLSGFNTVCTFDIKKHDGSYRYLRIRETGTNSSSTYDWAISALEYFGTLTEDQ